MDILDAHIHVWDLSNKINSWVIKSQDSNLIRDINFETYLSAHQSLVINGVVTIEAADSLQSIAEVQWLENIRQNSTIQFKHIAYIDMLQDSDQFAAKINQFKHYDFVVGFRDIMSYSAQFVYSPCTNDVTLSDKNLKQLYLNLCCLAKNNYIFDCQMYPEQLIRAFESIQQSKVKCVIDHTGLPNYANLGLWEQMLKLYNGNAAFKLSGLDLNGSQDDVSLICDTLFANIPNEDIHYGSNFPVTAISKNQEILSYLKTKLMLSDLNNVLFLNSVKFYSFSI